MVKYGVVVYSKINLTGLHDRSSNNELFTTDSARIVMLDSCLATLRDTSASACRVCARERNLESEASWEIKMALVCIIFGSFEVNKHCLIDFRRFRTGHKSSSGAF